MAFSIITTAPPGSASIGIILGAAVHDVPEPAAGAADPVRGAVGDDWGHRVAVAAGNLYLSASVGFVALFGVAVLNGIVMVTMINQLREQGKGG